MTNFDSQAFEHLKTLCQIECSEEEAAVFKRDLAKVLDYVALLSEAPTEGVPTCRYVLRSMTSNKMRDDVVKEVMPRDKFLANSPDQIGGMIRTPPILKAGGAS